MNEEQKRFHMKMADSQISKFKQKESLRREANQKQATNFGDFTLTAPMPIMPEWGRQDRVQEPKSLKQKNRYWRLYYQRDPIIATVIDLFAEMIASDFSISGEGIDGEIKDTYEYMIEKTGLKDKLAYFVKEYLAIGEVFPHLVFDDDLGIWTDLIFHNPDNIEIKEYPLWGMEPEISLKIDPDVKKFFSSGDQKIKDVIKALPSEFSKALNSNQGIKLDTNVNVSYLARKGHPYAGERGKSIIERMFSILTYEDSVFRASLSTAMRHASPLKIAKIGDKDMNWVPDKEYEAKLLELLAVAEIDPQSFLVLPWFVQFEAFGTTERAMSIKHEWEIIERVKLTALGISKGFMHGEAKYSNLQGNMETLFMRMKKLRNFLEHGWILPKFFRPVAEMNGFIKSSEAEINHNVKTGKIKAAKMKKISTMEKMAHARKMAKIEETKYILPTIHWSLPLETSVEKDKLDAFEQIKMRLNLPISKSTIYATVGLDHEEEFKQILEEDKIENEILAEEGVSAEELDICDEEMGEGASPGGLSDQGLPEGLETKEVIEEEEITEEPPLEE